MSATCSDIALRHSLRKRPGRDEWRGNCPACGYHDALTMVPGKHGFPSAFCGACQDRAAVTAALGTGPMMRRPAQPDERNDADRTAQALAIWEGSEPAAGTPADAYLIGRGLPGLAASQALRWRLDCPSPDRTRRPAMVALVVGAGGAPVGVHRTFLTADGSGKAIGLDVVKASKGPIRGGAIRLDPLASELVLGEGIESAGSAGRLLGLPAWAAISAPNLRYSLQLPLEVRRVIVAADPDEPGELAALAAAARWRDEGRSVRIARPNRHGSDFNDVLRIRLTSHA